MDNDTTGVTSVEVMYDNPGRSDIIRYNISRYQRLYNSVNTTTARPSTSDT